MSQAASRRDIVRVVTRHLLDEPTKRGVWLRRLAAYLVVHSQTDQVDLLVNDIAHELQTQAGLLTVEVLSARQLSDELRASIQQVLQRQTGAKEVIMHEATDVGLLGGFVARTADAEIDASVRNKLRSLAALA